MVCFKIVNMSSYGQHSLRTWQTRLLVRLAFCTECIWQPWPCSPLLASHWVSLAVSVTFCLPLMCLCASSHVYFLSPLGSKDQEKLTVKPTWLIHHVHTVPGQEKWPKNGLVGDVFFSSPVVHPWGLACLGRKDGWGHSFFSLSFQGFSRPWRTAHILEGSDSSRIPLLYQRALCLRWETGWVGLSAVWPPKCPPIMCPVVNKMVQWWLQSWWENTCRTDDRVL